MNICKTCKKNNEKCDILTNRNCYNEKITHKIKRFVKHKIKILYIKYILKECLHLCFLCDYKHECYEQFESEFNM